MIALVVALAPRVQPGAELGVLYPRPGGGLANVVLVSCAAVERPGRAVRGVGIIHGEELVLQYTTTRMDSGNLLASEASLDMLVG